MKYSATKLYRAPVLGLTLLPTVLVGQAADTTDQTTDQDVYLMSPFEVTAESTEGYSTTQTLGGTRLRTDLKDLANSISVVNSQFLKDTGVTNTQDLLVYTTNTEVGGVSGNFAGTGGGQGYNESGQSGASKLLRPNENTRVRGLDAADNTQNYYLTEAPWDGYNIERVEMQRGANSILFGVGSPAGIINAATKTAVFKDQGSAEMRMGSYGSVRGTIDLNKEIINDTLAVRVIGLYSDTKYQQKPAFNKDNRFFVTARYEPKLFGESANTSIRVSFEKGDIDANRPRSLPPIDAITPWFKTGTENGVANMNKLTLDPNTTWDAWASYYNNTDNLTYPWFKEAFMGRIMSQNPAAFYNADGSLVDTMMGMLGTSKGTNSTGGVDGTIGGIEFARLWAITPYANYAAACKAGGSYYANYSLSDPTIFDFYNKLIDGDNKKEWQDWTTGTLSLSQTFFNNRVGFEISAFRQSYDEGQYGFLSGDQFVLSVDVNTARADGLPNPNVGRPYVGNSGYYGNYTTGIDRNSTRFTPFVDVRSTDFLPESWLTRILGHHIISGLLSQDVKKTDARTFARWAYGTDYTDDTGAVATLTGGTRNYDWIAYLGPSLLGSEYTSAHGLNLSAVTGTIAPSSTMSVKYFDSTWTGAASGATSWGDPYTYYYYDKYGAYVSNDEGTQSDNPANYVGWTSGTYSVLSAENGDIDQLYTNINKARNTITSAGVTLQSYLLDDNVVFTYGWRKDRVKTLAGQASKNELDVAQDFTLDDSTGASNYAKGISRTWGVVVHSPDFINKMMPLGLEFTAFYGRGQNFKADTPRGDVFGNQIENPTGKTKDYGFIVSALDGRISLKTTWYKTEVANATLPASDAGFGSAYLYYVWALPYWEATHALAGLDGIADNQLRQGNWGWPWNTYVGKGDGTEITTEDKQTIFNMVQDFFANLPFDQHFMDEYGLGMNVAKMKAAAASATFENQSSWSAYYEAVPTYGLNKDTHVYDPVGGLGAGDGLALQPAYAGALKSFGAAPVASCDTTSKGIEWELTTRITDNWNVIVNVAKTEATISSVSPTLQSWIDSYTEFMKGPAGQIRLWGGDTFQTNWQRNIVNRYNTLLAKIGSSASEVSPWRLNLVTNYSFTEGMFKGVNVGMAYRWEDDRVLGYAYDSAKDALDISKPFKDGSEDHFDIWVGYNRKLNDKVNWRVQLNLRNVGEDAHLVPVYIQPDGTTAYSRIAEGMTWFLTNTFEF